EIYKSIDLFWISSHFRFVLSLLSAVGQTVIYPFTSTCAVRGSTVTLACTFTPPKSVDQRGREVPLNIVRVLWYQSHWYQLCQLTKPSAYDSDSTNNDPRYQYLGDMKTNCTLQIRDVQQGDSATFSFRMGVNHRGGHFTNGTGVAVRVTDGIRMGIISSSDDNKFRKKETVTLLCASVCTFHHLEVTWFKDGCILSETGSSLQLSSLTAEDSGNYTCALKTNMQTLSEPYSLQVEAEAGWCSSLKEAFSLFSGATLQTAICPSASVQCSHGAHHLCGISSTQR
uniref:Ig-like domain-containing protein n=1 Tax=Oreochromis aureus TaxID=47969 RepID=A0A668VE52_OREAU